MPLVLTLVALSFYFLRTKPLNNPVSELTEKEHEHRSLASSQKKEKVLKKENNNQNLQSGDISWEENFSFKQESRRVQKLEKELPHSRPQLMSIVLKMDTFKQSGKEVKPHSLQEDLQNKMGAVKVLALKALVSRSGDKSFIKRDLTYIIQKAQDPTISEIAKAALSSLEEDRPFFKDFVDGVEAMSM